MFWRGLSIIIIVAALAGIASAQSGGMFCVRAFEDRNANGALDAGEPLLTRGVSVNLLDAQNITIASSLLDQSPTAAQGVVCFQGLAPGQYTMSITSADYSATTPTTMTTAISANDLPVVMEFGGQRPTVQATAAPAAANTALDRDTIARIAVSALGALVAVAGMAFLGIIVYALAFRSRRAVPVGPDPRLSTGSGSMPAVRVRDTSETPKV